MGDASGHQLQYGGSLRLQKLNFGNIDIKIVVPGSFRKF